jgi:glycoside hydrolase 15-related protein
MTRTATPSHLPAASPDYWEVRERTLTLGTAAPVLMGLEAAHALARAGLDLGLEASALGERCSRVRQAVVRNYGPTWGRYPRTDAVDAAIALVGPPFMEALPGVEAVRATARARLGRQSGGLAPGSSWRDDGVSWTPETALVALSARYWGWQGEAEALLAWLEAHRTASGALPEKVRPDGAPAGPAPLAWTDALVLLATC